MKLNYKRTILVGFAFFLISAFWQAYDNTIALTLTNKFGMSQALSGVVMALDNVLALFLLPLFGSISDKCKSKHGRRKPFILIGTILAIITVVALSFVDQAQISKISSVSAVDDPTAMATIYASQEGKTLEDPDGNSFVLGSNDCNEEKFMSISCQIPDPKDPDAVITNPEYTKYVVPARQACIAEITANDPSVLILFIAVLLGVLLSMSIFRSPAVALMPDVTIKPLRSKGNAIINLMGTAGGIIILLVGKFLGTGSPLNATMSYTLFFGILAAVMLIALVVFMITVKEPVWAAEMEAQTKALGLEEKEETETSKRRLSAKELRSLILILASVALWYFGYNAVTSKYAVYANQVLGMDHNTTLLIAQAAAVVSYIPAGIVASKIGRRKTILAGVVMLTAAFGAASFMRSDSSVLFMNVLFATAGIAWATINVNSFPMVVEMCSGADVGKYTGFYYTASMAAQALTPFLSGLLMDTVGKTTLFPYAAVFTGLAFATMFFVQYGDAKVEAKRGLEALDIDD